MNKDKLRVINIFICTLCIAISIIYFVITIHGDKKINESDVIVVDTTYNKVILDSIDYNIKVKDSIIVNIKHELKYETEEAINANDSDAVKQFYKLVWAK